ncbi:MAG TPA: aminotransferase class III-fold pyridoxal phosphate-dependent enzyme, partial [Yaniella sp.]
MSRAPLEQSRKLVTELPGPKARELREQLTTYVPKALSPSTPAFASRTEGGIMEDVDGNRFIDLGSGIAVTTIGASHPKVVEAVQRQVEDFTHTCFMVTPYESYVQLAKRLDELVPISGQTRSVL